MTVLHSGSNNKYSANWAQVFGKGGMRTRATGQPATKKAARTKHADKKPAAAKISATNLGEKKAPANRTPANKKRLAGKGGQRCGPPAAKAKKK